ncbi:cation diffusion facilitator family transporter [Desulfosporosinus acidiphilus SJ4]|uniref:Cation diffusion facilitator family transporter n=1 Tax=Desulfosporosinus acidiphilus (strain DSM 22704 / JCM 16185 / SJ4) TaxID=646529 RepID=I4D3L8_DESAJ|nr:cation diffusion facilitator family transporter [Desulfosporosinus acidiphilus]AFM40392.1 cation diffusion facilitator family transporter [Desulfosporosinus acidiphilus SJ4]
MSDLSIYQSQKKIFISIFLVGLILTAKLTLAYVTKSLALLSDSWHLITDFAALIISWWGLKIAAKKADCKNTYGYYRYGVLSALVNNISLITISVFIFYKAVDRFLNPVAVEPKGMIFVAIVGMIVNLLIVLNLRQNTQNLNVKSAFLHFAGDALADLGVLIGGVIIYFTDWSRIDTLLSAILGGLILRSAVKMTKECIHIFLESVPKHISIDELRKTMLNIDGIRGITDIHVWAISQEVIAMTAHVWVKDLSKEQMANLLHNIQHTSYEQFGIEHTTIQFEDCPCSSCFHSKHDHQHQCSLCIDLCPTG